MDFTSRKISRDRSPFLKEKSLKKTINPQVFFGPEIIRKNKERIIFSKNLFIWLIILIIIISYLFFSLRSLFSPPEIIVYLPEDNYVTYDKTVKVKGQVKGEVIVAINDQTVTLNQNSFEEILTLSPGINLIKISARKKFSPERVVFRRIIVR